MACRVILLDDGGVMNDNRLRGPQWRRFAGEFFAPLLGGSPEAWSEANRHVADRLLEPAAWLARVNAAADYASFDHAYQLDWLGGMCDAVGLARMPADECVALAHRATEYITRRVDAAFPGAVAAIRTLRERGYTLHTASGECARDLEGYLDGMGVRDCFGRLYGPDLIDAFKEQPAYYARIFADLGIPAGDALVVDDSPRAIRSAALAGARTALVSDDPVAAAHAAPEETFQLARLAELPQALAREAPLK